MELNLTSQQFVGVDSTESSYGETTPFNIFELVPTYQARFTYIDTSISGIREVLSRTTFGQISSGTENWRVIEKQYPADSTLPSLSSELNDNTKYYWTFQYEDIKKDSYVLGPTWPLFYARSILEPWTWEDHPTYTGETDGILAFYYILVGEDESIWGNLSEADGRIYAPSTISSTRWADTDIPGNINTKAVDLENQFSTIVIKTIFRPVFATSQDTQSSVSVSFFGAMFKNGVGLDGAMFNSGFPGVVLVRGSGIKETLFSFQMGKKYKSVTTLSPTKVMFDIYDDSGILLESGIVEPKSSLSLTSVLQPWFSTTMDIEEIMIDGIV